MAKTHKIAWTEATWNPVIGCTKIASGCKNCYAERMAARLATMSLQSYYRHTVKDGKWNGEVFCLDNRLQKPLHWTMPRKIFVCSMSDLFHEAVPFEYIDTVYSTMMSADWHTYQILTKRPERALEYYESVERDQGECCEPNPIRCMPNVQLLVSVSTQEEMDKAENVLWQIPAVVRGFSFEPLLGPIRDVPPFEWHIVGCESGPKRRPCKLEWVRDIVRQCKEAGVACFVKQIPRGRINPKSMKYWQKVSTNPDEWPQDLRVREYPR